MQSNLLETLQEFGAKHKVFGIILSLMLVAFIGVTDYLTGRELSFSIFYLIPVSVATLLIGRSGGIILSVSSAAIWLVADLSAHSQYSNILIPFWNATVRLGYFLIHMFLLSYLQRVIGDQRLKSLTDPLTGAANWRFFEQYAQKELEREKRNKKPLTLVYFDIDNFKKVNDSFGHDVGDELLKLVAELIQNHLRQSDLLARVGGDEFVILLSDTNFEKSSLLLDRVKSVVMGEMQSHQWPVSLSIGAVTYLSLPASLNAMIKKADALMYSIKHSGKNDIKHIVWPSENHSEN